MSYNKISKFFRKYSLEKEKHLFDYGCRYGWPLWVLRTFLWLLAEENNLQFDASFPTIIRYIEIEGFSKQRKESLKAAWKYHIKAKKKRPFRRQDKNFSTEMYRELIK